MLLTLNYWGDHERKKCFNYFWCVIECSCMWRHWCVFVSLDSHIENLILKLMCSGNLEKIEVWGDKRTKWRHKVRPLMGLVAGWEEEEKHLLAYLLCHPSCCSMPCYNAAARPPSYGGPMPLEFPACQATNTCLLTTNYRVSGVLLYQQKIN